MSKLRLQMKKRFPITMAALLAGAAFAGTLSNIIETPQGQNDYLHEHLSALSVDDTNIWNSSELKLPPQDRLNIASIIARADTPSSSKGIDKVLTGQALETYIETLCKAPQAACTKSIRIKRSLSEAHLNSDNRVANIEETSLRIDFKAEPDSENIAIQGLFNETRILSFYKTQAGWLQNVTRTLSEAPELYSAQDRNFEAEFLSNFVGLNYYPASASWRDFWVEFPLDEIKHDLEKAKSLNVNALRIFLTHDYFDDSDTRAEALEKLQVFLDLCHDKDIQVLITLFDLRPNYTISNWASDIEHIDDVLESIAAHKAILGIDLKNQPDLDFENWGSGVVEAWLTVMARHIQTKYAHLPVTTGWSRAENAGRLSRVFDVVTYHDYENPKAFDDRLNSVMAQVGGKPVMITELGSTIWHPPFIKSLSESAQATRLETQLSKAKPANGVFVWTLNDFDHVGKEVVGPLPWRQAQQRHFGLLRSDGSPRPAANILKTFGAQSAPAKLTLRQITHF